jgi:hypothetical protein
MIVTGLEIADTAVKIGLGALISGGATYLLAKYSHQRELEKEFVKRRRDALESIAESVHRFNQNYLAYVSKLITYESLKDKKATPPESLVTSLLTEGEALGKSFTSEMLHAESRLLLLGEIEAQQAVRELAQKLSNFIEQNKRTGGSPPTVLMALAHELNRRREVIFNALSAAYRK